MDQNLNGRAWNVGPPNSFCTFLGNLSHAVVLLKLSSHARSNVCVCVCACVNMCVANVIAYG